MFLAEAAADGSGFHEIMRGTKHDPVRCARWTPGGKYLFTRVREDIWLLSMKLGILRKTPYTGANHEWPAILLAAKPES